MNEIKIINTSWTSFSFILDGDLEVYKPIYETEKIKLLFEILKQKGISFAIEMDYEKDFIIRIPKEEFKEIKFLINENFSLEELNIDLFTKNILSKELNLSMQTEFIEAEEEKDILLFVFKEGDFEERDLSKYSFIEESSITDALILNKTSIKNTKLDMVYILCGILLSNKTIIDYDDFYSKIEEFKYDNVFDKINSISKTISISPTEIPNLYKNKTNLYYLKKEDFGTEDEIITFDSFKLSEILGDIDKYLQEFWFDKVIFALSWNKNYINILFLLSLYYKIKKIEYFKFEEFVKEIKRISTKESQEFKILVYLIIPLFEKYLSNIKSIEEFESFIKKLTKQIIGY